VNSRCGSVTEPGCEPAWARLRAILETEDDTARPATPLLPDLEAVPPFNLRTTGDIGARPGCLHADTRSLEGNPPQACLRMAFGYQNVGRGPLELRFQADPATLQANVFQHVFLRDDTPWDYDNNAFLAPQPAGTATYHTAHGHWHYDDIFVGRLYRVEGTTLIPVGPAEKRGACAHDGIMAEFAESYQDTPGTNDSGDDCTLNGNASPTGNRIGLSRGWADIYGQSLPDQYFDFSGQGDGMYLAQVEIDAGGLITEGNEDDNFGYVLFGISNYNGQTGASVIDIVERGRGRSHLDPDRVLLSGIAE
jgi:hypothetical protein